MSLTSCHIKHVVLIQLFKKSDVEYIILKINDKNELFLLRNLRQDIFYHACCRCSKLRVRTIRSPCLLLSKRAITSFRHPPIARYQHLLNKEIAHTLMFHRSFIFVLSFYLKLFNYLLEFLTLSGKRAKM